MTDSIMTRPLRIGEVSRQTRETNVYVQIHLDDAGACNIDTPLPFVSHMLSTLACHGRFGMVVQASGDIEVDPHHLIEDLGIVLGEAMYKTLGSLAGIERTGCFSFPMDKSLAVVAIDLCGRRNLIWNVEFGNFPVGNLDPNLFHEFFKGFVDGARATLHINLCYRDNDHHAIEAVFKAFAKALRQAVTPTGCDQFLSTKGVLDGN